MIKSRILRREVSPGAVSAWWPYVISSVSIKERTAARVKKDMMPKAEVGGMPGPRNAAGIWKLGRRKTDAPSEPLQGTLEQARQDSSPEPSGGARSGLQRCENARPGFAAVSTAAPERNTGPRRAHGPGEEMGAQRSILSRKARSLWTAFQLAGLNRAFR